MIALYLLLSGLSALNAAVYAAEGYSPSLGIAIFCGFMALLGLMGILRDTL